MLAKTANDEQVTVEFVLQSSQEANNHLTFDATDHNVIMVLLAAMIVAWNADNPRSTGGLVPRTRKLTALVSQQLADGPKGDRRSAARGSLVV